MIKSLITAAALACPLQPERLAKTRLSFPSG